ncbi:universal stress protein [Thiococcus pfennigii]|jgi:nucleotide-binding universal stress UspA family protein|uniref:universal stress protein n=1 Tax=Thiococcus pfennigii TaxID=1057 RepID=UPI0019079068|nr:universal stress protein [Thiococcus pfennigii]MBK1700180.1 universal stress protein UspA [Thiococcus pfennigii]MBK1731721.1 universal stress protein UspA [Thiococcus pfennigii]
MTKIQTILLATDFSQGAARACDMAATLARAHGASLILLHVITELGDRHARLVSAEVIERLSAEVERHAVEDMHGFRERHFQDLPVVTEILIGRAHAEIVRYARQVQADLIVMGTHGRAGLEKMLLGSTAEKVIRSSPIPVLTVRE